MRFALIPLLGALIAATPAVAQGYYRTPAYGYDRPQAYGYTQRTPDAWSAAREEWRRARRAEDMARWRAANSDYEGANRAHFWAERHRDRAHRNAHVARDSW
jgi:hypothetical protein